MTDIPHRSERPAERLLYTETGASWLWLLAGPVAGLVMVGVQFRAGMGLRLGVPAMFMLVVSGFLALQVKAARVHTSVELTGEMLRELMTLGAATGQMDEMVGNQMSLPPGVGNTSGDGVVMADISGQMNFTKPHSIVVDQSGVRYMNEGGSYMEFCKNMLARNRTVPALPSWWVFDDQYIRNYMMGNTMAGANKPVEWFTSGYLKKADTIEELASLIGVEAAVLRGTVDRFNAHVRGGKDLDFNRGGRAYDNWLGDPYHSPSATLGAIDRGPFYAAPVVPGNVGTYGGVVTDTNARVLREDGTPIPGLYATGTTTASVMGRIYPGAGSSIGPSFTWGFVAAKHASGTDNSLG